MANQGEKESDVDRKYAYEKASGRTASGSRAIDDTKTGRNSRDSKIEKKRIE